MILSNDAKVSDSYEYDPSNPGASSSSSSSSAPSFSVRILIPHAASGVIIGRAGANIREISSTTETRLQLADAADPYQTKERLVTISGANGANVKDVSDVMTCHLPEWILCCIS